MGRIESGENPGAEDDQFNLDREVSSEQREKEAEGAASRLAKKIEAMRARGTISVVPSKREREDQRGGDKRIPIASSYRAKKTREPHPVTPEGDKIADTEIEKPPEQEDAEKKLQQIIDRFVFIGEFRLEKSQKTEGNFFFELFDTRKGQEQKISILKCKNNTIAEIQVALEAKMSSSFKVKKSK